MTWTYFGPGSLHFSHTLSCRGGVSSLPLTAAAELERERRVRQPALIFCMQVGSRQSHILRERLLFGRCASRCAFKQARITSLLFRAVIDVHPYGTVYGLQVYHVSGLLLYTFHL